MKKTFIVGITGGSASGKTSFINKLGYSLGEKICIISQDDYYRPKQQQPLDSNGIENFDMPESIDHMAFFEDIKKLCEGSEVRRLEYTFNQPGIQPATKIFQPSSVVIIEGIFLLNHAHISDLIDLKIFLETEDKLRLERRIRRDGTERGHGLDDVLYRYDNHAQPNYEKFILPFRESADLIIPNNTSFDKAFEVVLQFLKHKLNS